MSYGRTVSIGRLSFHFSSLNLILWALGICFLLEMALAGGLASGGGLLGLGGIPLQAAWAAGADGPVPVFQRGEWWRLFSAVFLHASLVHLLMNAMAFYNLGRIADQVYGPTRLLLVFLATGLCASVASDVWMQLRDQPGANLSVGASGAVCGVMGVLLANMRSRQDAMSQYLGRQLLQWAIIMLVFGLVVPRVNNAAHIGGFAAGYLLSFVLREQHFDHLWPGKEPVIVKWATLILTAVTVAALLIAATGAKARLADLLDGDTLVTEAEEILRKHASAPASARTALSAIEESPQARELRDQFLAALDEGDKDRATRVFYEAWRWAYELAPELGLYRPPPGK